MASPQTAASDDAPPRDPDDAPLPPGPDGLPVVGNTFDLIRDPFAFYDDLATYGDVVRFRSGPWTFTTLLHPAYIERVLVEEPWRFERWAFTDIGLDFAPEGLLEVDEAQWRRQRTRMQPAFTMDRVQSYGETMTQSADALASEWPDGDVVAVNEAFADLTLRILAEALFGVTVDPQADDAAIPHAARVINEQSGPSRSLSMFFPDWVPTPANRRYQKAMTAVHDRMDDLIAARRTAEDPGDDLLSILLARDQQPDSDSGLSDAEIRDNLLTFMFAGHETTALGLTYTVLLLATHDEAMARLQGEVDDVLAGRLPTPADLPALSYTEQVIQEALRLYPPAFILFRRATEDAVIGGYRIPEDTILTLPQFRLHTDDRFYDDPDSFRPDRWAKERDRPEYAYFPFGGGPRHCIGMRFAMLELQLITATLAQQLEFTLQSDPDPDVSTGATLRPTSNVRVRVTTRNIHS